MKSLINVKTIIYIIICIGLVFTTWYITNKVTQDRTNKLVESINDRYRTLEDSNKQLQDQNNRLIETNRRLTEKLEDSERIIERTVVTVRELETGINESESIIDRIGKTVEAIQRIIDILPEQIILLEESDSD